MRWIAAIARLLIERARSATEHVMSVGDVDKDGVQPAPYAATLAS